MLVTVFFGATANVCWRAKENVIVTAWFTPTISGYRPDVDGLRAIAVLSVMLFHINNVLLPGGFVGVDVFFVISGFLITRNILQDLEQGRFSIVDFYRRRVKRIAPAMLVVVLATVIAAQLLMLPEDAQRTAQSAVWSLCSLANVYFWRYQDTSYFATDNLTTPLLHLWSLGIEEQFYMIFPVLLMLVYRPSRAKLFFVSALTIALFSFLLGDVLFDKHPSFVYYMPPTRAGELLLGILVAIMVLKNSDLNIPNVVMTLIAMVGLLLLMGALFLLSENHRFPGWRALLPTLGTVLLLLAGHRSDNWVSRLLALKPLVGVGLISYSAYLWHWPLLIFFRYGYGEIGALISVTIFVLTMMLAWLSYVYVEQPARRSQAPVLQTFVLQYGLPAGILGMLAFGLAYADRFGIRLYSDDYRGRLAEIRNQTRGAYMFDYVCQRGRIVAKDTVDERCLVGANSADTPRAILWGDSNAAHYIGMLGTFAREKGFRFRNLEIDSCPPIDVDPKPFVPAIYEADCRESLEVVQPVINAFPVVIMSAVWSSYQEISNLFLQRVFDTVTALTQRGKLVILIGQAPVIPGYDRVCQEKALRYPFLNCNPKVAPVLDVVNVNANLRRFAEQTANVQYFEVTSYLCPKGVCAAFSPDGKPLYYDPHHLTMAASWELGKKIVQSDGVPTPFTLIADWPRYGRSKGSAQ